MDRRNFIKFISVLTPTIPLMSSSYSRNNNLTTIIRPPLALLEDDFVKACINCHRCGEVCSTNCIKFVDKLEDINMYDTPYIRPREKGCILCMKCTNVCPSGALRPIKNDQDGDVILDNVKMGTARVDKNICNSYNKYTCGVCVRACPFSGKALKAEVWEKPVVDENLCVGCGLCEQACIHYPQAIRVKKNKKI